MEPDLADEFHPERKSKFEDIIGEGRDLRDGKKPTILDVFLMIEFIRNEHLACTTEALELSKTKKINNAVKKLKEHFPSWSQNQLRMWPDDKIYSKISNLLLSASRDKLRNKKKLNQLKSKLNNPFEFFYEIEEAEEIQSDDDDYVPNSESEVDETEPVTSERIPRDFTLANFSAACEKAQIGDKTASMLATSLLKDLSMVSSEQYQFVIDRHKIARERAKFRQNVVTDFKEKLIEKPPCGIFFDSKITDTANTIVVDGIERRRREKLDQYVVVLPTGEFLESFVKGKQTDDKKDPPAKIVATQLINICQKWGILDNIKIIGGDTCNMNTGTRGGIFHFFEQMVGVKLYHVECQLHINELPLREVVKIEIGETKCKTSLKGNIGSMLPTVTDLPSTAMSFKQIHTDAFFELPHHVVSDLSSDQHYAYLMWKTICNKDIVSWNIVKNLQVGPLAKSRWLTMALRLCRLFISDRDSRDLDIEEEQKLENVVQYVIKVYLPMWFKIKTRENFLYGPENLLYFLKLSQTISVNTEIQRAIKKSLENNSYWARSDKVILSMLCNENIELRRQAVDLIVRIRQGKQKGFSPPIEIKKPKMNFSALTLPDLLDGNLLLEPIFTAEFETKDLKELVTQPQLLKLPVFPGHTQSVERQIRRCSEVSSNVWDRESRDARMLAQQQLPTKRLNSKKDLTSLVHYVPPAKLKKTHSV